MVKKLTSKQDGDCPELQIRAHHLLCMEGFQGYGYDKIFTENLRNIIRILKEYPGIPVTIISETDEICKMCPNKSKCDGDENLKAKDQRLIRHLNLNMRETRCYNELRSLIYEKINFKILDEICGACQWINKCKFYLSQKEKLIEDIF